MSTIYLLHHSDDLFQALQAFKKLLDWPHQWKIYQKNDVLFLDQQEFFIVHNHEPEKLDAIRAIQNLRSNPETFGIPVLFLSEKLSEYAQLLYDDLDFIWSAEIPFNSHQFFEVVGKLQAHVAEQSGFLQKAGECAAAIAKQDQVKARSLLNALGENFRSTLRYQIWITQLHMALNEWDRALETALAARALRPRSLEVGNLLSAIYFKKGDNAKYKEVVNEMTKIAEIHLQNLLYWGDMYLEQGKAEKSLTTFEAVLSKDPENQRAKQGVLAANLVEGKFDLAGASELASSQSMEIARMFNLKGISMAEGGHYRSAERLYSNAVKILPNQDIAYKLWLNLGLCMKKKGDLEAALDYFKKCAELAPPDYTRADVQIQFLQEEIKKERQKKGFEEIREQVTRKGEALNYKKMRNPSKGA